MQSLVLPDFDLLLQSREIVRKVQSFKSSEYAQKILCSNKKMTVKYMNTQNLDTCQVPCITEDLPYKRHVSHFVQPL